MNKISNLLADDDKDDDMIFREVLAGLPFESQLTIVQNGEELLYELSDAARKLPDTLFPDLNIPGKNGLNCLREIKSDEQLKQVPALIFSASDEKNLIAQFCEMGHCIVIKNQTTWKIGRIFSGRPLQ